MTYEYEYIQLTRTNLQVEPISRTTYLFGKRVSTKMNQNGRHFDETMELQFLYLDSDLCITMIGDESEIMNVYTNNKEWRESRNNKVCLLYKLFVCIYVFLHCVFICLLAQTLCMFFFL